MDFETGLLGLEALIEWAKANDSGGTRNEATTRLHLIDRLLFECLGWRREDCVSEERFEGTYTDYALGRPGRALVVEAKREGVYFELPAGFMSHKAKLRTVNGCSAATEQAMHQALVYCQERGIPVGAICNGQQLVAFIGSRQDGVAPLDGDAIVFTSLDAMRSDFRDLWDNLSAAGVASQTIYRSLSATWAPPPPEKLSKRLPRYPGFKNRNPLQVELQILGDLFIEDITKAPEIELEFLEKSYCQAGALSQYAVLSRQLLEARYSVLFQQDAGIPAMTSVRTKAGFSAELTPDILTASMSRRPIILLGDVGVGKTTFIRHFIRIDAKDILERALVLYIDFGREPALSTDLNGFVIKRCASQLRDDYGIDIEERQFVRGIYHLDLVRFEKGIYADLRQQDALEYARKEIGFLEGKLADQSGHLRKALEHISRGHKRQVVIFLDNVDQRPAAFQEQVFLIAQSLAERWPGTVFVSLRPETFFESKSTGSLRAYQPRVFTIAPPRIDMVIRKRLEFALEQLSETGRLQSFPAGLTLGSTTLTDYLTVLTDSFDTNRDLMEFVDNMSGGNVRQALGFLRAFIGSGHVNTQKILDKYHQSGSYQVPLHEFLRAVLFGDHEYFEPAASPLANVFDISGPAGPEHFLLCVVLVHTERMGSAGTDQGYVSADAIHSLGQSLGFQPQQVQWGIDRAVKKNLLESRSPAGAHYRVTTIGAYTARRLVGQFAYLDAVIVDTPITDAAARAAIWDAGSIEDRLTRASEFVTYLDSQWVNCAGKGLAFEWTEHSSRLKAEIEKIRRRLQGAAPPPR